MTKTFTHGLLARCAPAILLFATACGGGGSDDSGGSSDGLRDAISTAFVDNIETDGVDFKADKALGDCVADSLLNNDEYSSNLEKAYDDGLAGQDLLDSAGDTESDVEISRKIFSCFSTEQLAILLSAQVPSSDGSVEESRACLTKEFDAIDKEVLVDGIFALNSDDTAGEGPSQITAAMISCFGLESFGE